MRKWVALAIAFLLFILFANINSKNVSTATNMGNILYVGGDGEGNYSSIQDAINDAQDGDTIIVYPGNYKENIVVYKKLKIIGIDYPVIEAGNESRDTVKIIASNCTIESFKITNGENGIKMMDCAHNNIKNCFLYGNNYSGLYLKNAYHVLVMNDIFADKGIYMKECGRVTISNNNFTNCGIFAEVVSETKITHNSFFNGKDMAIAIHHPTSYENEISYNQIKSFRVGISFGGSGGRIYHNNIVSNDEGILCHGSKYAKSLIYENNHSNNRIGIDLLNIPFDGLEITRNNFVGNELHAGFLDCYFILWHNNYWDDWSIPLPRPIFGRNFWFFLWVQFDWRPLMQLYEWWKNISTPAPAFAAVQIR